MATASFHVLSRPSIPSHHFPYILTCPIPSRPCSVSSPPICPIPSVQLVPSGPSCLFRPSVRQSIRPTSPFRPDQSRPSRTVRPASPVPPVLLFHPSRLVPSVSPSVHSTVPSVHHVPSCSSCLSIPSRPFSMSRLAHTFPLSSVPFRPVPAVRPAPSVSSCSVPSLLFPYVQLFPPRPSCLFRPSVRQSVRHFRPSRHVSSRSIPSFHVLSRPSIPSRHVLSFPSHPVPSILSARLVPYLPAPFRPIPYCSGRSSRPVRLVSSCPVSSVRHVLCRPSS